jgi:hypothetical protein
MRGMTVAGPMLALILALGVAGCEDSIARDAAAADAANQWLALVDAGEYGASWDASATLFQRSIGRPEWEQSLTQVRAPLGKVAARSISQFEHLNEVPNAPRGSYITIHYETSFDNRPSTVERVSAVEAENGWQVSGYFIQ